MPTLQGGIRYCTCLFSMKIRGVKSPLFDIILAGYSYKLSSFR